MTRRILIELGTPEALVPVIARLRALGFRELDAHTPWPVKGVEEALGLPRSPVARRTLIAGLLGALTAYLIQWWTNAVDYPLDVGGRPAHAAPAFVLITFETTVLFAGITAFLSVFRLSRLPRFWNPLTEVDAFRSATIDRFWISVADAEPPLPPDRLRSELEPLGARQVLVVEERGRR